jgi:hypothetical protein
MVIGGLQTYLSSSISHALHPLNPMTNNGNHLLLSIGAKHW